MENKIWVLMTGNVRDPEKVIKKLDFIAELIEKDLIAGWVFSTWTGEVDKYPQIQDYLIKLKAKIVCCTPPNIMARGSYVHQMRQMQNGLLKIPEDSFILKIRTDKCDEQDGFFPQQIIDILLTQQYIQPVQQVNNHILNYRIGTLGAHTNISLRSPILFFFLDRWYIVHKQDLRKLLNFNILDFDYYGLIPEQVMFASHFIHYWSVFERYFQAFNQDECINKILMNPEKLTDEQLSKLTEFLVHSPLFIHGFLTERYIISEFFYDVASQLPLNFNTHFNDYNLFDNDIALSSLDTITDKLREKTYENEDVEGIKEFLLSNFNVEPLLKIHTYTDTILAISEIETRPLIHLSIFS